MSTSDKPRTQKPIPRWLIFIAVVVTAGTTVWAISQTNLRGPQASWDQAQGAVDQVWGDPAMAEGAAAPQAAPMMAQVGTDPEMNGAGRTVAGLPGVPVILFGARRPHADRGPCTICHGVVSGEGTPVPAIHSFSSMPHGFRGNCTNCHQITIGRGFTGSPVAATMLVPSNGDPQQLVPPQMMPQQMMPQQMVPQQMVPQQMVPQQMMPQQMVPQQMMPQQMMPQQMMPQQMMSPQMVPQQMAPQMMPQQSMQTMPTRPRTEAEWRGMEVRTGGQGVVVTNAEGTAARSGLQPGDLVTSINGSNVPDIPGFVDATQNGALTQGTVVVRRGDQRLAFELQPRGNNNLMPDTGMGAMPGQLAVN